VHDTLPFDFYFVADAVSQLCQPAAAGRKAMLRHPRNDRLRAVENALLLLLTGQGRIAQQSELGPALPTYRGPYPTTDHTIFLGLIAQVGSPAALGTNCKRSILLPHKVIWNSG
jgi:hypothetical protein